jgi:hypothetical protein
MNEERSRRHSLSLDIIRKLPAPVQDESTRCKMTRMKEYARLQRRMKMILGHNEDDTVSGTSRRTMVFKGF